MRRDSMEGDSGPAQTRRRFLTVASVAGTTAVAGCSAFGNSTTGSGIVHGSVENGTTGALVNIIDREGIDEENDITLSPEYFTSPPKVQKQIVYNDQIPTGFMGSIAATRLFRDDEASNPEIAGPYQNYHMHVLTREDSDIDEPADLAGKTVSWSSKSADAWLKFTTILNLDHGVDPDELEFVQTAPPASTSLLADGELDAILQYEPLVTKALLDHDFEVVYSPRQAWDELEGLPLTTVDLAWSQSWYENNSEVASRLRAAFEQGQQYLTENLASVLENDADLFGLETDEQITRATDRLAGVYPESWSDDLFDSEYRIVEHANELGLIDAEPTREIFRTEV